MGLRGGQWDSNELMKQSLHVGAVFHVKRRKSNGEQVQPEMQAGWKWFFLEILAIDLAKLSSL